MRAYFLAHALLGLAAVSAGQSVFRGRLDPALALPEARWQIDHIPPTTAAQKAQLPVVNVVQAWMGQTWLQGQQSKRLVAIADSGPGGMLLLVDVNGDGQFQAGEIRKFENRAGMFDLRWDFPAPAGQPFRTLPVAFRILGSNSKPGQPQLLHINDRHIVTGTLDFNNVRVFFGYDAKRGAVDPRRGAIGVDTNRDGRINSLTHSPENALADDESIVFRVGDVYLSAESIDLATLQFTMRSHAASDYTRIELARGTEVPDFTFTDMAGKDRRLSEHRGYVLLNFWGSWCGPCVEGIPDLHAVNETYRAKGLEIIGMTKDDKPEAARKLLQEKGCTWPNAEPESVKDLITKRFRIERYPTYLLLDPNRTIVSMTGSVTDEVFRAVLRDVFK